MRQMVKSTQVLRSHGCIAAGVVAQAPPVLPGPGAMALRPWASTRAMSSANDKNRHLFTYLGSSWRLR
jgi:hypothetical protein